MRMMKNLISAGVIIFFLCSHSWGADLDLDFSGHLQNHTVMKVREENNDFIKMENKLRVNVSTDGELASFYGAVEVVKDHLEDESDDSDESVVDLKEAYLDLAYDTFDIRLGKQIVVWGKSDGNPITDIVVPQDLTEFIIPDIDELRMAIPMAKVDYYLGDYTFQGIFIPKYQDSDTASTGDWVLIPDMDEFERKSDIEVSEIKPEDQGNNYELGFRISGFLLNSDVSIMYFNTWDDVPTMEVPDDYPATLPGTKYNELNMYGLSFSRPVSSFVVRGESAFYPDKNYAALPITILLSPDLKFPVFEMQKKDFIHYMLGTDYSGISNTMLSFQIEHKYIFDFKKEEGILNLIKVQQPTINFPERDPVTGARNEDALDDIVNIMDSKDGKLKKNEYTATFVADWRALQETLRIQFMCMYNFTYEDYLMKLTAGYNITDALWVYLGYNLLEGDDGTNFGIFDHNDNVYLKLKYSF